MPAFDDLLSLTKQIYNTRLVSTGDQELLRETLRQTMTREMSQAEEQWYRMEQGLIPRGREVYNWQRDDMVNRTLEDLALLFESPFSANSSRYLTFLDALQNFLELNWNALRRDVFRR